MNDRFKFRAKRCDDNRFVYGYLVFIYIDNHKKARIYCPDDTFSYDVYTDTLGQCTGLKDKNGKLIYDGDILKISSNTDREVISPVVWDDEETGFCIKYKEELFRFNTYRKYHKLEIIGNIYENKEYLKQCI